MSCSCTNQALRRFIFNISQVEIPHQRRFATIRPSQLRTISSARSPWQIGGKTFLQAQQHRQYSVPARPESNETQSETSSTTGTLSDTVSDKPNQSDAILDITPETLDQLLAEQNEVIEEVISKQSERKAQNSETVYEAPEETLSEGEINYWVTAENDKRAGKKTKGAEIHESELVTEEPSEAELAQLKEERRRLRAERKAEQQAAKEAEKERKARERKARLPQWAIQKNALKEKFPEGWNPRKKLSPDALAGIRALHAQYPKQFTTEVLAEQFEVSPEAIRRILRSKWQPTEEQQERRMKTWEKRGEGIWERYAALGYKPPQKWRAKGIGKQKPEMDALMDLRRLGEGWNEPKP